MSGTAKFIVLKTPKLSEPAKAEIKEAVLSAAAENSKAILRVEAEEHGGSCQPSFGVTRKLAQVQASAAARRNARRRGGPSGKVARGRGLAPRLPPDIDVTDVVPFRRRFIAASSVASLSISRGQLAMSLGGIGTTSNATVTGWASSFRITRIVVWPPAGGDGTLEWAAGGTAEQALAREELKVKTIPTGVTSTGGAVYTPPKRSYLSMWQVAASNPSDVLLYLTLNSGAILDVMGAYTLSLGSGNNTSQAVAVAAVGGIYYLSLDGSTSHQVIPVALPTTH